jgi:hypothetical protein
VVKTLSFLSRSLIFLFSPLHLSFEH